MAKDLPPASLARMQGLSSELFGLAFSNQITVQSAP
jgi:hypothetical protein